MHIEVAYKPGSVTKNLGLEALGGEGFERLQAMIREGFGGRLQTTTRAAFRARTEAAIADRQLVLLNLFLHNSRAASTDTVSIDELVRFAFAGPHTRNFDLLALFALHLARVGDRQGNVGHPHGAAYFRDFVRERLWRDGRWWGTELLQGRLEPFLEATVLHKEGSQTIHKTVTNYQRIMSLAGFSPVSSILEPYPKETWRNCLYLAFDRYSLDQMPMFPPNALTLIEKATSDELYKLMGLDEPDLRLFLPECAHAYVADGASRR